MENLTTIRDFISEVNENTESERLDKPTHSVLLMSNSEFMFSGRPIDLMAMIIRCADNVFNSVRQDEDLNEEERNENISFCYEAIISGIRSAYVSQVKLFGKPISELNDEQMDLLKELAD